MQLKTAPSTQLASLPPQLSFILLYPLPSSANWSPSPTAAHAVFMCDHPTTSVPQPHLAGFTASSISHRFILHTITAMIPLPRHSPTHKAVTIPPLSDVTTSAGDSMSFRTWPNLSSSRLPYRCAIVAPPDSSCQTTKCSFHLHTRLFLPDCPVSFYFSFEVCLFL